MLQGVKCFIWFYFYALLVLTQRLKRNEILEDVKWKIIGKCLRLAMKEGRDSNREYGDSVEASIYSSTYIIIITTLYYIIYNIYYIITILSMTSLMGLSVPSANLPVTPS